MLIDYEQYSDVQLIQLFFQKGDKEAGNALFRRYEISLHDFFEKKMGDSESVKDLVQETFFETLKSLKKGQSPKNFRAWLYKIATRVMMKWFKEQQKQGMQVSLVVVPENEPGQTSLAELLPAPMTDQPEHQTVDNELGDIRRRFESTLGPEELAVFRLRHSSNMTFKEIGQKLGIKSGTAKVRYHRSVKAFKVWLKEYYPNIY